MRTFTFYEEVPCKAEYVKRENMVHAWQLMKRAKFQGSAHPPTPRALMGQPMCEAGSPFVFFSVFSFFLFNNYS